MKTADYASDIRGFRFLEGDPCYQYQATEDFSEESAMRLLSELPEHCQISFFDPDAKTEESWVFVRRVGRAFRVQYVGRGFSRWKAASLREVVALFAASPLVKKPSQQFDSFRVELIPEHQRYEHTRRPWWRFWP